MCGIAGIIYSKNTKDFAVIMNEMLALVRHRGPDGHGLFVTDNAILGHTRLSVIDLSQGGQQPMCYMDRFTITFNGEIYNYIELRDELIAIGYSFKSKSDTEVILAAYAEWGESCVNHLNGMFAFGIYDTLKGSLFLARDRVGEKPLYYYKGENEFSFFSEPKQAVFSGLIEAVPNEEAIRQYLEFQFTLDDQTFFKGIHKLLPGHFATLHCNEFNIKKYWSLADIEVDHSVSYEEAKHKIKDLVVDSLKIRLRSDVKVASYLSGGIDSTVLAALAAKELPSLSTFTFTSKKFMQFDESIKAYMTSKIIHSDHYEIEMEFADTLTLWMDSIYFMDEPEVGYSLLSQMVVSRDVAKQTKVVLGGQGGDELFFGYGWYNVLVFKSLFSTISEMSLLKKIKIVAKFFRRSSPKTVFRNIIDVLMSSGKTIAENYLDMWRRYGCCDLLLADQAENVVKAPINVDAGFSLLKKFEFSFWLQGLLHVEDRSSMATGLESRVPLLDHRLIEFVFSLPPDYMIDGGLNKKIFIDAFKDVIPYHVVNAKEKQGYVSPVHAWFAEPAVSLYIKSIIDNKNSYIFSFVDQAKLKSRKITNRQIWMLISLEIWHQIFFKKQEFQCVE